MDKLSSSESLKKVIDLADKTTKTCQKKSLTEKTFRLLSNVD